MKNQPAPPAPPHPLVTPNLIYSLLEFIAGQLITIEKRTAALEAIDARLEEIDLRTWAMDQVVDEIHRRGC